MALPEIIIENTKPWEWYITLAIFLIAIIIIWNIVYIFNKFIKKISKSEMLGLRKIHIIAIGIFLTIITVILFSLAVPYSFDYSFNNIHTSIENVSDILPSNASVGQRIKCVDSDIYLFSGISEVEDLVDSMADEIIGHTCEIEYYKWSKMIIRVTVID